MPRLPLEIKELVYHYFDIFVKASNRPSLKALRKLVIKSNYDIRVRYLSHLREEQLAIPITFFLGCSVTLNIRNVFLNSNTVMYFFDALSQSLKEYYATALLDWLVEQDDEILWLPGYEELLASSYYIQLVHLPMTP